MAVTVTVDASTTAKNHYLVRHAFDATTNTYGINNLNFPGIVDANIKVQGTNACRARQNGSGLLGCGGLFTNANLTGLHIASWTNNLDLADTKANNGWRIRFAANGQQETNFAEVTCGGNDTQIAVYGGYSIWCINPHRPFDFVTGTPAALTGIGTVAMMQLALTGSGRETWFQDAIVTCGGIFVSGGTPAAKGKSSEIAANDRTNGRGLFMSAQNAYYVLGKVLIGDPANASSEFQDNNEVWIFQDQPVSAAFHGIEFEAGTGTNNAIFGTKSGSGATADGSGGNTFKSAGPAPFTVRATDSAINVGFYGCNFIGPVARMWDAPMMFQYSPATPSYTDVTRDASDPGANDFLFMPATEAVGDFFVVGHHEPFQKIELTIGTAGTVGAIVWEYWNGSAWTALDDVTDGTNGLKTSGTNEVTFAMPNDWASGFAGAIPQANFMIRGRVTTVYTVNPVGTQCRLSMGGMVHLMQANAEVVRCVFTNMDMIHVANGAGLRKCTIANSVASAKCGALHLPATGLTGDTVRDLTITGAATGIVLKGTSTGTTTYDFKNIQFSGNTNDVRVDFPAGATVTINILEGGSTPTVQNVNGSTVNVVSAVRTVKVSVVDAEGTAVTGARAFLRTAAAGSLPYQSAVTSITRSGTVATVTQTAHGMDTNDKVLLAGITDKIEDNKVVTITKTGVNTYTFPTTDSGSTAYTGTITATFVFLNGLANTGTGSNEISMTRPIPADQAVLGWARKSSGPPLYKAGAIAGTVVSTADTAFSAVMISDD